MSTIVGYGIAAVVFAAMVGWLFWAFEQAPSIDKERLPIRPLPRVDQIQNSAAWHRERLDALSQEFVDIHGAEEGSDAADELRRVIYDGEDYRRTMQRIEL